MLETHLDAHLKATRALMKQHQELIECLHEARGLLDSPIMGTEAWCQDLSKFFRRSNKALGGNENRTTIVNTVVNTEHLDGDDR